MTAAKLTIAVFCCVVVTAVSTATACDNNDACKAAVQFTYWTGDNFETKEGGDPKCCATNEDSESGFCYNADKADCKDVSSDPSAAEAGGGQRRKGVVCQSYEKVCGVGCIDKLQKCESKSPHWDDAKYKEYVASPVRTLLGAAGMRVVWVPMSGMLASILVLVLMMLKRKDGLMGNKPLMIQGFLGIIFNMFMFLGDGHAPGYAITIMLAFMVALVAGTSGNNKFVTVALIINFLILFNALGFSFTGNGAGLSYAAAGDALDSDLQGCDDAALSNHFRITQFSVDKANPDKVYGGLCSLEYLAFSYFLSWIVVMLLAMTTLNMVGGSFAPGAGGE